MLAKQDPSQLRGHLVEEWRRTTKLEQRCYSLDVQLVQQDANFVTLQRHSESQQAQLAESEECCAELLERCGSQERQLAVQEVRLVQLLATNRGLLESKRPSEVGLRPACAHTAVDCTHTFSCCKYLRLTATCRAFFLVFRICPEL